MIFHLNFSIIKAVYLLYKLCKWCVRYFKIIGRRIRIRNATFLNCRNHRVLFRWDLIIFDAWAADEVWSTKSSDFCLQDIFIQLTCIFMQAAASQSALKNIILRRTSPWWVENRNCFCYMRKIAFPQYP